MEEKEKSYAREVALVMLTFVGVLFGYGIVWADSASLEAAKFLTTPVVMFAGAAFGLDKYLKQR